MNDTAEVTVIDIKHPLPDSCILAGTLTYEESINSPAQGYNQLIESAKKEARKMGGNIVKVTELKINYEYKLSLSIYFRYNTSDLNSRVQVAQDSIHKNKFGNGMPTFAILYVYRPREDYGSWVVYTLDLNGKASYKAKSNTSYEMKLYQEGTTEIRIKGDLGITYSGITFNAKFGEEYYVKCSVRMPILPVFSLTGVPVIEQVPKWRGSGEYEEVESDTIPTVSR